MTPKAPWMLTFMLLPLWLPNIISQTEDCAQCFGAEVESVCTASGITLPSPCLATCHGLEIVHDGACHDSDLLVAGLFLPSELGPAPGVAARSGGLDRSTSSSGRSSADGSDSNTKRVVKRFQSEGFVYVGHVAVTPKGPTAASATAFVSRLTAKGDAANARGRRLFGNSNSASTGTDSSTSGSSSSDSGVGDSTGSSGTETGFEAITEVAIRGVRVAADGAVYLERETHKLDLSKLPATGETDSVVGENDSIDTHDGSTSSSSSFTGSSESSGSKGTGSANQRRLQGQVRTLHTGAGTDVDARLSAERLGLLSGQLAGRRRRLADDTFRPDVRSWPHSIIGQLFYRVGSYGYICSGTWISPYDVLTAAHCVFDFARRVESRDFTFEAGKIGSYSPDGRVTHSFVTFYRTEYPRSPGMGVNYYDIALIRMTSPTTSYMGLKYSCDQIDYPKTETCGYMQDASGLNYQQCDECYYASNGCNPMVQPVNWCYTVGGQSGSPIYDLSDYRILGVLSGGLAGPEYEDYSIWTPIDAIHFANLRRWMWQPGQAVPTPAPNSTAPQLPLPPPPPKPPSTCLALEAGRVRLTETTKEVTWGRAEVCYKGVWGMLCSQSQHDEANANVICRQLGYPKGSVVAQEALPAISWSQETWLEPTCSGNETRLSQCPPLNNGTWKVGPSCPRPLAALCRNATYQGSTPNVNRTANRYPCSSEGAVRLQGSGDENWGRVEFCSGDQWGSVCHDGWDDNDAAVVCRQLGYPYGIAIKGAIAGGSSPPGPTTMRIWLQQVNCSGSERRLSSCPVLNPLGLTDCSHRSDAGVMCFSTPPERSGVPPALGPACGEPGSLRVVPDTSYRLTGSAVAGRLEVCYARQWGAVCSTNFDSYDATVACQQLGYQSGRAVPASPLIGQPIWMSDVRCDILNSYYDFWPGRLTACAFTGTETVNCPYGIVAGVECTHGEFLTQNFPCSKDNSVRLVGGTSNNTGRLEVCRGGQWGTLCGATVSAQTASVMCRQLGYNVGFTLPTEAVPSGHPDSPIWEVTYRCRGSEARLSECPTNNTYPDDCWGHDVDAGLLCLRTFQPPSPAPPSPLKGASACATPGQVRLVDGLGRLMYDAGRLEICIGGRWGTVCSQGFGAEEANVACRHYGFVSGVVAVPSTLYGPGQSSAPIHMRDVVCRGIEARITQCGYFPGGPGSSCTHSNDVSVVCSWKEQPLTSPPRPSPPGPSKPLPRMPPLRSNSPPKPSPSSPLKQPFPRLPPPRSLSPPKPSPPSPPKQPIPRLPAPRSFSPPKPSPPSPPKQPIPRLPPPNIYRPPKPSPPLPLTRKPPPASPPPRPRQTCDTFGAVRLVGGDVPGSGMLQYCGKLSGSVLQWGSVCGTSFKPADASMVCRQMNYTDGFVLARPYPGGYGMTGLYYVVQPNPTDLPMWLADVACPSDATRLSDCSPTSPKCIRSADVALACLDTPKPPKRYSCINSTTNVRLVGGPSPDRGIVQVCRNSYWGAICDEGWDDKDATVLCRQLGYTSGLAVSGQGREVNGTSYGPFPGSPGDMRVWFTQVACKPTDASLDDCEKSTNVSDACIKNSQDAGVICRKAGPMG